MEIYLHCRICIYGVVLNYAQGQIYHHQSTQRAAQQKSKACARQPVAMWLGGTVGWVDILVLDPQTVQRERCGTFVLDMCLLPVKVGVGSISTSCPRLIRMRAYSIYLNLQIKCNICKSRNCKCNTVWSNGPKSDLGILPANNSYYTRPYYFITLWNMFLQLVASEWEVVRIADAEVSG